MNFWRYFHVVYRLSVPKLSISIVLVISSQETSKCATKNRGVLYVVQSFTEHGCILRLFNTIFGRQSYSFSCSKVALPNPRSLRDVSVACPRDVLFLPFVTNDQKWFHMCYIPSFSVSVQLCQIYSRDLMYTPALFNAFPLIAIYWSLSTRMCIHKEVSLFLYSFGEYWETWDRKYAR